MRHQWLFVACVGGVTALVKAAGPVVFGCIAMRPLPRQVAAVMERLPPALFAALVVTQVFARGQTLVVDARAGGLAAAIAGNALGAPRLVALAAAVFTTAALRHLGY